MKKLIIDLPAKYLMGKGIDKRFPFLVTAFKKVYLLLQEEGQVRVSIPINLKLFVSKKDAGLGLMLRMNKSFEPLQTNMFISEVKKGNVVVDIGANVGYYTALAGKLVSESGKVFSFEPEKENFKLLSKNVKLNSLNNVEVTKSAVGDKNGSVSFFADSANPGESGLSGKGKPQKVKLIKLDTFLGRKRIKKIDVVKIDVEGAEIFALQGAKRILSSQRKTKLLIEVNSKALSEFGNTPEELIETIERLGFNPVSIINEHTGKVQKYSDRALNNNLDDSSYVTVFATK